MLKLVSIWSKGWKLALLIQEMVVNSNQKMEIRNKKIMNIDSKNGWNFKNCFKLGLEDVQFCFKECLKLTRIRFKKMEITHFDPKNFQNQSGFGSED